MKSFDYIVVGGGLAGLYTAHLLSDHGSVLLLTRDTVEQSNSYYAQGGIAAVTDVSDRAESHYSDTIEAGRGLCDERAVKVLTDEAPSRIDELIALGMQFDTVDGHLALGLEGGHHHHRILHAGGDATGRLVTTFMIQQVGQNRGITIYDHHLLLELIADSSTCYGIRCYDSTTGQVDQLIARATVLATGGAAALYHPTTNPPTALGDGLAIALRAGVKLMDLEFIQFHPTALALPNAPSFLISEAVRGEGAYLLNRSGERFMLGQHPLAELAPRDTVARAIYNEMKREGSSHVTLSLDHLNGNYIRSRFPNIAHHCAELGLDLTQRIPIAPAAHYTVGGIATDLDGSTSLHRLYAVGEVASTGVMGANRLASNSLIECLVYGKRIAQKIGDMSADAIVEPMPDVLDGTDYMTDMPEILQSLNDDMEWLGELMMSHVGIVRTHDELQGALQVITERHARLVRYDHYIMGHLMANRYLLAQKIVEAALAREESRGGHYRQDHPSTLDPKDAYRTEITLHNIKKHYL